MPSGVTTTPACLSVCGDAVYDTQRGRKEKQGQAVHCPDNEDSVGQNIYGDAQ